MNKDFESFVKENIKDYLPDYFAEAEVDTHHVLKSNNRDLISLFVKLDSSNFLNNVYLNEYEERYYNGEPLIDIMKEIAQNVSEVSKKNVYYDTVYADDLNSVFDYEKIKPKLAIRLCGLEESKEFLKDKPYTPFGNLAITYRVQTYSDGQMISSYVIDNQLFETWNISKEQLHQDALKSQEDRSPVLFVDTTVLALSKDPKAANLFNREKKLNRLAPIYTLTNEQFTNGACVIIQDGVLEKVGELLGRNFYILPSSIHEVMIRPKERGLSLKQMSRMVRDINRETVAIDDKLSDKAMYYDRKQKKLVF